MRSRTFFFGIVEFVWASAGGLGPVMGGAFTEMVSWRWCFWINLPICGATFIVLLLCLDVHNPRTKLSSGLKAVDWFGIFSILAVTILLLVGLDFGGAILPWSSPKVICLIVFGTVMIAFFMYSQKKLAKYPLIPYAMFQNRSTVATLIVGFCHGMVFISAEYYLPLYFQSVKGAKPLRSGVLVLPIMCCEGAMGITTGMIAHFSGRYREMIWLGTFLMTVGTGLFINLRSETPLAEIVGYMIVNGLGAGLLFQPPLIAVQAMASQADTATATATLGFIRNMATSLGVVLGGIVFQNGMNIRLPALRDAGLNNHLIHAFSNGRAAASVEVIATIKDAAEQKAVKDAFAWSMRNMWILFTCFAALGFAVSWLIKHRDLSKEHTETRTGIEAMEKGKEEAIEMRRDERTTADAV